MRIVLIAVAAVALGASAAACAGGGGEGDAAAAAGQEVVVAGFYPVAFAAGQVAAPAHEVVNLTPPGVEPHDLELSVRDVALVREADVVLLVGEGFQPALEDAAEGSDGRVVDLLDGEDVIAGDPHVWLDPLRYARLVERVAEALGRPEAARSLSERLRELDREFERGLADCARRELVASHAAYGYLATRYGLEQVPIAGVSPEAEAAPADVARTVDLVRERGVTTIFVEPLLSRELAETVARETGARTEVLDPLEGLTEDAARRGEDYFSLMRANLAALRRGLGCR